MSKSKTFASVWDAIADTPAEAMNLRLRAELMSQIIDVIEANDWSQAEAAKHAGVLPPRISDLLRGQVHRFSLDALVNMAAALGCEVHMELQGA